MNQKNRLLREAYLMLRQVEIGIVRPLASVEENEAVRKIADRIAKNLNITPAVKV